MKCSTGSTTEWRPSSFDVVSAHIENNERNVEIIFGNAIRSIKMVRAQLSGGFDI